MIDAKKNDSRGKYLLGKASLFWQFSPLCQFLLKWGIINGPPITVYYMSYSIVHTSICSGGMVQDNHLRLLKKT